MVRVSSWVRCLFCEGPHKDRNVKMWVWDFRVSVFDWISQLPPVLLKIIFYLHVSLRPFALGGELYCFFHHFYLAVGFTTCWHLEFMSCVGRILPKFFMKCLCTHGHCCSIPVVPLEVTVITYNCCVMSQIEAKTSISQPDVNLAKINVTISDQIKTPQKEPFFMLINHSSSKLSFS